MIYRIIKKVLNVFTSQEIIANKIAKEYGCENITLKTYGNLERILIGYLRELNDSDLNEKKLEVKKKIQRLDIDDIAKTLSVPLNFVAIMLSLVALTFDSTEVRMFMGTSIILSIIILLLILVIYYSYRFTQGNNLVYYSFVSECIDKMHQKTLNLEKQMKTKGDMN